MTLAEVQAAASMLLNELSKTAGKLVYHWTPINRVADDILGHDKKYSPVARDIRHAKRVEVSSVLSMLVRDGKVVRDRTKYSNKVRINEAFVQNRSLIR